MRKFQPKTGQTIAESHFTKVVINNLSTKGIELMGIVCVPDENGNFSETAYQVNDNGIGKIWSYGTIAKLAQCATFCPNI